MGVKWRHACVQVYHPQECRLLHGVPVHSGRQKSPVPGHAGPGPCHACPWSAAAPGYSSAKQPAVIAKRLQTTGAAVQAWAVRSVTMEPGQPSIIFGFSLNRRRKV